MADHPITPPQELVEQWWDGTHGAFYEYESVVIEAARWGADQELEAIRQLLEINGCPREFIDLTINARRPKPPSLKEQALNQLAALEQHGALSCNTDTIRRALEALSDD